MPFPCRAQHDFECAPRCSAHSQRNYYFYFAILENLRIFQNCLFTGGVGNELPQSKPNGFDSSLGEGASGIAEKFPAKAESLRACPLPLGGAVAQRLRGFKSAEPEKNG